LKSQIIQNNRKNNIHKIQRHHKNESSHASEISIPLKTIPPKGKSFSK